jgi:hypothetical protein
MADDMQDRTLMPYINEASGFFDGFSARRHRQRHGRTPLSVTVGHW